MQHAATPAPAFMQAEQQPSVVVLDLNKQSRMPVLFVQTYVTVAYDPRAAEYDEMPPSVQNPLRHT